MAFDQATRNKLQNFVSNARTLLTADFTRQMQNDYGMDPDTGEFSNLDSLPHLNDTQIQTARLLRDTMKHYQTGSSSNDSKEILGRIVREQAFTVLNRLCAMRLAEARGILIESIGKSYNSKGFQLYTRVAGTSLGETGDTYRNYLFSLFDEFAHDLAVLFDRYSPMGRLFPRESALLKLLDKINDVELEALWAEDETIGWIYQYFNSVEERKQMRAESQAPRNSRELAVRNQFFTPRYVVEFLTDNTLGRIWYEMTKGNTVLIDQCRYLVRRPNEIFLEKGEEAPEQKDTDADFSQEELLKQPVYIAHRPIKDPRKILMLDPACGSMHFGLYAFYLFEKIYEEAWDLQSTGQWQGVVNKRLALLTETYATRDELLRDVPRLIIENNIHGIDIDPRAVQIAGLSLWLRAQRSWKEHNVKPGERPQIQKSNIVCAEPMPGDKGLLKEFSESLKPKVLGQLLEIIFEKMELAGEAGSLLKIEEEIEEAVENAREEFNKEILRRKEEAGYLPGMAPKRQPTLFDFADLPDKTQFWETAEEKILDALRDYAEKTEEGAGGRRRLFVEDAAKGFAFIDICRKRFDVVLMNPPFGEFSNQWKKEAKTNYINSYNDILSAFVERGLDFLSNNGRLGAITSRTCFFLSSFKEWRENVLLKKSRPIVISDLGRGVMDAAMVEAAAYILEKVAKPTNREIICMRLLDSNKPASDLRITIKALLKGEQVGNLYIVYIDSFRKIPGTPFSYWIDTSIVDLYSECSPFESEGRTVRVGLQTSDDFRFVRVIWEIPYSSREKTWFPFAKGGSYAPYYTDIHLVVNWAKNGKELESYKDSYLRNTKYYFIPGLTWPRRSKQMRAAPIPSGCIFSHAGMMAFVPKGNEMTYLALMNSSLFDFLAKLNTGSFEGSQFEVGVIQKTPIVSELLLEENQLSNYANRCWEIAKFSESMNEESSCFIVPDLLKATILSLDAMIKERSEYMFGVKKEISPIVDKINQIILKSYRVPKANYRFDKKTSNEKTDNEKVKEKNGIDLVRSIADFDSMTHSKALLSWLLGVVFGRWDIRTTRKNNVLEVSGPLDPVPICPPGMLQNSFGLPADLKEVSADYPFRITWSGIMVDDEGQPEDIITRIREAIEVIWKGKANDIEQEVCELLSIRSLREYFSRAIKFFADHLKRYSKSRCQAPIYWPLSTPSGSYTLWLYYHRLNDQILYTCVNDFVEPKLKQVSETTDNLRKKTGRTSQEEKELEKYSNLELELKDFRNELLRIAKFWKPNLNDGVQITAAPLWKLFQHKPWQKKLKQTWSKLEKGEYDWAHLAYSIWPERVINASHKNRSYAIAHDLEEDLWEGIENGIDRQGNPKYKWAPKDLSDQEIKRIISEKLP